MKINRPENSTSTERYNDDRNFLGLQFSVDAYFFWYDSVSSEAGADEL